MDELDTVPLLFGETLEWPSIDDTAIPEGTGFGPAAGFKDTRADDHMLALSMRKAAAIEELAKSAPFFHKSVTLMWGSQELQNAFARWLVVGHDNTPLPYMVAEALLVLHDAHAREFGLESAPIA